MAEQQQPNVLAAAFPSPPPFYEHFTPENLERIATLRAAQQASSNSAQSEGKLPIRLLDLPPELRFLQPPDPPAEGRYRSFGDFYNLNEILPSLKDQGIEQLYTPPSTPSSSSNNDNNGSSSHNDRALILKRIAKSLLLNFLELMGILSINPDQYTEKIQDLRTLFINFHHLLNEYRPHQARESLILMMEAQLERARMETEGIEKMKRKVEGILKGLGQAKLVGSEEPVLGGRDTTVMGEDDGYEREVWSELEKEFG